LSTLLWVDIAVATLVQANAASTTTPAKQHYPEPFKEGLAVRLLGTETTTTRIEEVQLERGCLRLNGLWLPPRFVGNDDGFLSPDCFAVMFDPVLRCQPPGVSWRVTIFLDSFLFCFFEMFPLGETSSGVVTVACEVAFVAVDRTVYSRS